MNTSDVLLHLILKAKGFSKSAVNEGYCRSKQKTLRTQW